MNHLDGAERLATDVPDHQAEFWPAVQPLSAWRGGRALVGPSIPANAFLFIAGDDPFLFLDGDYFTFF